MSQANVEKFYELVQNNEQLQEQLKAAGNKESFLDLAVQLGQENGYTFTSQDVDALLNQKSQEGASELSDAELASVAGGEAEGFTFCITKSECWSSIC